MQKYPIYHVSFSTNYLLTATMMRFQEHYESPKFRGSIFTHEEFMDWYAADRGSMSYFTDWSGFNVPSWVIGAFRSGKFDPLSRKERSFLDLLDGVTGDFYVIATSDTRPDPETLAHETVHGLYYAHPSYAAEVRRRLGRFNLGKFRQKLRRMGYHAAVIDDELNAYLSTGPEPLARDKHAAQARAARRQLVAVFRERFGIDPSTPAGQNAFVKHVHLLRFRE